MSNVPERYFGAEWEMIGYQKTESADLVDASHYKASGDMMIFHRPFEGVFSQYKNPETAGQVGSNIFMPNGARWYPDTKSCLEYATPECLGPDELTVHAHTGTEFVARTFKERNELLAEAGEAPIRVHRRVYAPKSREAVGFHENYAVSAESGINRQNIEKHALMQRLLPFLVGRILINGAGESQNDSNGKVMIALAQRAKHISRFIDSCATRKDKPWVLNRSEELNGSGKDYEYLRLQICGDANVNPWATHATFTTTSIVLRMIENGLEPSSIRGFKTVAATTTRMAANDAEGKETYDIVIDDTSKKYTLVDILESYYLKARQYNEDKNIFSAQEQAFLPEWGRMIDEYREDPLLLSDALDWAWKREAWMKILDKPGSTKTLAKMQGVEMYYDAVAGVPDSRKIGQLMLANQVFRRNISAADIEQAIYNPPQSTRASKRGKLVVALHSMNDSHEKSVNWPVAGIKQPEVVVHMPQLSGELSESSQMAYDRLVA